MSETLARIRPLVLRRDIRVSAHGARELAADGILVDEVAEGINDAIVVEDYPAAFRGPSVLVFQRDRDGRPIHVLWGLEKEQPAPAVLVTAYRPAAKLWSSDFLRRSES